MTKRHSKLSGPRGVYVSEVVFAFGSNMCSLRLRDYSVSPERPGVAAVLRMYRLRFNKRSRDGSGKANAEPDSTGEVWGVLYSIPSEHLKALDQGEGSGYSRRREVVRCEDGTTCEAWVYVASKPDANSTLRPYGWYKRLLVEGAKEHGLPPDYITQLEGIDSVNDPDMARDRKKREIQCGGAG